jgi:hypothetical protein
MNAVVADAHGHRAAGRRLANTHVPALYVSPSKMEDYETCGQKYKLKHKERITAVDDGINLVYGDVIDCSVEETLTEWMGGKTPDPVAIFNRRWNDVLAAGSLTYSTAKQALSPTDLASIGAKVMAKFLPWWEAQGYEVLRANDGKLVMQRNIEIELPGNVIVRTKLDVVVRKGDKVRLIDWKTAKQASQPGFETVSDQLTAYEVGILLLAPELGFDPEDLEGAGFVEFTKHKKDPLVIASPFTHGRRSTAQLAAWVEKALWMAEDIRRGRFPKRPGMAFNSPCKMCDYVGLCWDGDTTGLSYPKN